ncbi:MAG: hypothetical protein AAGC77_09955 [Pseudomonadota bacterium]
MTKFLTILFALIAGLVSAPMAAADETDPQTLGNMVGGPIEPGIPITLKTTLRTTIARSGFNGISGEAQCMADETISGGGYELLRSMNRNRPIISIEKNHPTVGNGWAFVGIAKHDEDSIGGSPPVRVYAVCQKLVYSSQ